MKVLKYLFCVSLIFHAASTFAQEPDHKFTESQLREDLQVLNTSLSSFHTGLYAYTSQLEFDREFQRLMDNLDEMTEREFLQHIGKLSDLIRNGHTRFSTSQKYWDYLSKRKCFFPFQIRIIEDKMYLFENYAKVDIEPGLEITGINGIEASAIITNLLKYVPTDGFNQTGRVNTLSKNFARYHYLFQDQSEQFKVDLQGKGSTKTVTIPGTRFKHIRDKNDPSPPLQFRMVTKETALLTIHTFDLGSIKRAGLDFFEFTDKVFNDLVNAQTKNLIIDLRNNGGGSDGTGNYLVSYLLNEEFNYYRAIEVKNNSIDFYSFLSDNGKEEWNQVKEYFNTLLTSNENGTFDFSREPILGNKPPLQPHENRFSGNLVVLINGGTFSAAGEVASMIQSGTNAIFVGEETGGNCQFNVSGYTPVLHLPHSGIRVRIPGLRYVMDVSPKDPTRGVMPDYQVIHSIGDLLAFRDVQLQKAIEILK